MSSENLVDFFAQGVCVETVPAGGSLRVKNLELVPAVQLGHALTLTLDKVPADSSRQSMYTQRTFPLDRSLQEAAALAAGGERIVFGETRPDSRNFSVRVAREAEEFSLVAGLTNDYENPALRPKAWRRLLVGFVAVIGALDPRPDSPL